MKRLATSLVFAAPLALLGVAAFAEDYNFTVPVSINELPPEIREIEINCAVWGAPAPGASREQLGGGSVRRAVTGGALSGDVRVPVTKSALAGTRVPTHWTCSTRAYGTISGRPVEFWTYEDPATRRYGLKSPPGTTPRLEIPAKTGAALVVQVGGELGAATAPGTAKPAAPTKPAAPAKPAAPTTPKPK